MKKRCIECGSSVNMLFKKYGTSSIRLFQCSNCQEFADKYVEFDLVVLFIDLILLKKQAYRNIVFNRISYDRNGLNVCVFAVEPQLINLYV